VAASRRASAVLRTCIRLCSAENDGRPPTRDTTSPSSSTSPATPASPASSGYAGVTSLPSRLVSVNPAGRTSARVRTPSHLNSYAQPGPVGSGPAVASIGCTALIDGLIARHPPLSHGFVLVALALAARRRQADDGNDATWEGMGAVRAIWKGAVSFGLVSIPVKLYTATEEKNVSFHQVHRTDGGRIRYKRVCQLDSEEVPYSDIAKGYELPSGETVVITDEDLADLPLTSSRVVDVLSFVPLEQVDPIYFAKSYYLEPDKTATKPYVLLRDALEQADSVALVKVAIRTRESLATLRVRDGVLVLETMVWPDEVRTPDFAFLDDD